MRIVLLATGVGNVRSVRQALDHTTAHLEARSIATTADPDTVRRADVLVVPGQGSFGAFAAALDSGLREALRERIAAGVPYLGICLGLQVLFEQSEEAPDARGLGILGGHVRRLTPGLDPETQRPFPLPHVGWNSAVGTRQGSLLPMSDAAAYFYFAHSYAAELANPDDALSTTTYGAATFASAVRRDNVVGIQFHPEKSQRAGLALLERFFAEIAT
jgi:imidazole glycerol-phosphate synthase subunit HisH